MKPIKTKHNKNAEQGAVANPYGRLFLQLRFMTTTTFSPVGMLALP